MIYGGKSVEDEERRQQKTASIFAELLDQDTQKIYTEFLNKNFLVGGGIFNLSLTTFPILNSNKVRPKEITCAICSQPDMYIWECPVCDKKGTLPVPMEEVTWEKE